MAGVAADVVLWLQAVNRDDDVTDADQLGPLLRDLPHGARDELHVDAALRQQRQQRVQLAVADERLAADDRHVKRPVPIDQVDHAVDQLLTLEVAHLAQREVAAEMIVAIGVAAGAVQRAFARDFDRQRRRVPASGSDPRRR